MEILSIIPARGGSKGIKLKNLIPLNRKPLLYYTIKASKESSNINRTIVSTDHKKIAKVAKLLGAEVVYRPSRLAGNKTSVEAGMIYTLNYLRKTEKYEPDLVLLLQATSPLRTSKHIDEAINFFIKGKYDSVLSGLISRYFFWESNKKTVRPLNYDPSNRPNRQEMKSNQFIENGAIYITKYDLLQTSKCRVSGKIGIYIMPRELSIDINNKFDLFLIQHILKQQKNLHI